MPELTKSSVLSKKIIASLERLQGRGAWKRRLLQLEEKYGEDAYRSLFYILAHLDFTPAGRKIIGRSSSTFGKSSIARRARGSTSVSW